MQRIRLLVLLLLCVVCQQTFAQQRTISGLVISAEDHEPLIGATISVQGNEAHGVVTDIDGKYTLEVGPDDKILVVAYLGMKTQLIKVPKKEHLNVVLQPETMNLEEVVVTGYGNFTKSSFTGSANTRLAAASTLSSSCTNPPIKDHFPIAGSKFRFSRSSFNSPSSKPKMIQSTDT